MRFEGDTVFVTGGGSGIGRATAERAGREGGFVVVTDVDVSSAETTAANIEAGGGDATFHELDVTDEDAVHDIIDAVTADRGLDVLVNNAGVSHPPASLEETDTAVREHVFDVNIRGVWNGCHAALPHLKEQGSGAIVNVASLAGFLGLPKQAAYSASKGATLNLTRAAAAEAGPHGVRVNAVCPGFTDTPLIEGFFEGREDPVAARKKLVAQYPLKRLGEPEEIAATILFLASDDASWITGHGLVVDGGYSIA